MNDVHRDVLDAVRENQDGDDEGIPFGRLYRLESLTPYRVEQIADAVDYLRRHGEVYGDERLRVPDAADVTRESDGGETVADVVDRITSDAASGAPRTLVEEYTGPDRLDEALDAGDVYEVGRRVKITRRRA